MRNPNGYGSCYKLSGNRRKPWIARVTTGWDLYEEEGNVKQRYYTIGYYATRKEAMVALALYNDSPFNTDSSKITFDDLYHRFLELPRIKRLSLGGLTNYTAAYAKCSTIKHMVFADIKKNDLQSVIDLHIDKSLGVRRYLRIFFGQLYKLASELEITEKDYSKFLDLGADHQKKVKVPFSLEEIQLLKDNVDSIPYVDMILIMIYSGMRVSEMLEIKTCNVYLEERYLIAGKKTAAGINRTIPIHSYIAPFIESYYKEGNEFLFVSKLTDRISYDNYRATYFDKIMDQLGMKHTPHDCRHTFISLLDSLGCNQMVIKKIVGHAGSNITESIYTHKTLEELIRGVDLIQ